MTKEQSTSDKLVPILVLVTIALAFGLGIMWQKVNNLQGSGNSNTNTVSAGTDTTGTANAPAGDAVEFGKLSAEQASAVVPVSDKDHVRGSTSEGIYLIEYSDFECPFCSQFHTTAQQAIEEYDGRVAWVYRHFPLDQIHPNARPAAYASECVAAQSGNDAFWNFADAAFENQTTLSDLATVANEAGLDGSSVASCAEAETHKDIVDEHFQSGSAAGVTGTPGNFIYNSNTGEAWFLPGAYPIEDLRNFIDEALGQG